MKELLPIGSVVLLNNGKKSLMIIGVLQHSKDDNTRYDYLAVLHPEGHINNESFFLFNQEDIQEVKFIGLVNAETQIFRNQLIQAEKEKEEKDGGK